jgi:hypothetical protein
MRASRRCSAGRRRRAIRTTARSSAYISVKRVEQPAPAPRFSRTAPEVLRGPPERGEGGAQALADWGFRHRAGETANIARSGTGGEKIMLGRLMPREGKFFDLFNAHAARIVEGARELASMIGTFSELEAHAQRIDAAERAADKITHETITLLHKTFITPFDRDQIHQLINTLDDILDLIQDVAESVALYDLRKVTPEARQLAEICQMCCDRCRPWSAC